MRYCHNIYRCLVTLAIQCVDEFDRFVYIFYIGSDSHHIHITFSFWNNCFRIKPTNVRHNRNFAVQFSITNYIFQIFFRTEFHRSKFAPLELIFIRLITQFNIVNSGLVHCLKNSTNQIIAEQMIVHQSTITNGTI